jgi:hypothetical protein
VTPQAEWARCRPWIEAALATSPNLESIEDVERAVERGAYQVWFGKDCCAITEIAQFEQRKILIVKHGGGDLTELLDVMEPKMCAFARANGCDGIMGEGRRGWERVTEKRGYRFAFLTMIKDLEN